MGIMKPEHKHLVWKDSHILYAPYIQEQTQRVAPQIEQAQEFKALNLFFLLPRLCLGLVSTVHQRVGVHEIDGGKGRY